MSYSNVTVGTLTRVWMSYLSAVHSKSVIGQPIGTGVTDEQVKQLKDMRQSQCTENRNYEFCIESFDVDRLH